MVGQWQVGAPLCALAIATGALGCAADGAGESRSGIGLVSCQPGQTQMCLCAGLPGQTQTCQPNGSFSSCPCNAPGGGQAGGAAGMNPALSGSGGAQATNAGTIAPPQSGSGGAGTGVAGVAAAGRGGGAGGNSGAGAGAGGAAMTAGSGGAVASGDDPFALERQVCVDTINMYRMMLGRMPLVRATPEQEACSDMGAKQDGDSGQAHGSAGSCRGLGSQNSCPGYSLRIGGGTLEGTLKYCLMQMWGEGEPTEGVQACIADRTGCFQQHGHWINMQSETAGRVACGFYQMANGAYWMNQNFGR